MDAVVVEALAKSVPEGIAALKLSKVPRPTTPLAAGEVRIGVRAASLNFFDLLMLVGKYQHKPPLPYVALTEGAGVVLETGPGVSRLQVGQRVFFGSMNAAQEELVVGESQVYGLPDTLSFAEGAGFLSGYKTAYHAFTRGRLQPGEFVLVTGAGGGMGLAAIQIAKLMGGCVIACASDDTKLSRALGADFTINYAKEKLKETVEKITNGHFCDVIYESVGGEIFDQCVRCVAPSGLSRLLVIGFASGQIPSVRANVVLIKGFDVIGVRAGAQLRANPEMNAATEKALFGWAEKGLLKPYVCREFEFTQAREAFQLVFSVFFSSQAMY
eukprot:TRINITY_DN2651_c0_g1_i1.p1 TRINITY_DN2651_c0_g1~~TRINITY_DN2651_c0_g1_i1.p1  ORF type:complete len:328 (-),score=81.48 TRINITY_DN2651_c0_g1_i1:168-1151(-)